MATKKDTRSITSIQSAKANTWDCPPPVMPPSCPEAAAAYANVLGALPAAQRQSAGVRALALELGEAMAQAARLAKVLAAEGDVVADAKGNRKQHPASAVHHGASLRIAALVSRLKLSPQGDARELARMGGFEAAQRGHASLVIDDAVSVAGQPPDWSKILAAETTSRRN